VPHYGSFWIALLLHLLQEQESVAELERPPDRPIHHLFRRHRSDLRYPTTERVFIRFRTFDRGGRNGVLYKRLIDYSPTNHTFVDGHGNLLLSNSSPYNRTEEGSRRRICGDGGMLIRLRSGACSVTRLPGLRGHTTSLHLAQLYRTDP
jgi:hypothetical protein